MNQQRIQTENPKLQSSLDNNATNSPVSKHDYQNNKLLRGVSWIINQLQKTVQSLTCKKSVRNCGRFPTGTSVVLRTNKGGGNARFVGLNRCLNTTVCMRCSHIRGTQRAKQIDSVAKPIIENGGTGAMLTLTVPHRRKDDFKWLNKSLNRCWDALMRQKFGKHCGAYNESKKPLWVRSWDYTWGLNGDHVHLHALVLFETEISKIEFEKLEFEMKEVWRKLVKKNMQRDASPDAMRFERVYDVEGVSKYNNKIASVCFEIASSGLTKTTKKNSYNIPELIWAIQNETDPKRKEVLIRKFKLFEKQTTKLRTISFSKTFRERIVELEDEEIAEQIEDTSEEKLKIRGDLWELIRDKGDSLRLLDLYNSYTTGDQSAKPAADLVERVCERYSEENNFYNNKQMEIDWGKAAWKIKRWEFYKDKPQYYHYKHEFLVGSSSEPA